MCTRNAKIEEKNGKGVLLAKKSTFPRRPRKFKKLEILTFSYKTGKNSSRQNVFADNFLQKIFKARHFFPMARKNSPKARHFL